MTATPPKVDARNVVLIGYRGTGKTSVGRHLAEALGWTAVDTDRQIEEATGCTIREIFARWGERRFRELETHAIADLAGREKQVISVGGGAVLRESNRIALHSAGICVWLTAPVEVLASRLKSDPRTADTRPALTKAAPVDEIRRLLDERAPLYASLADHTVDTASRSVAAVAEAVLAQLTP